MNTLFSNNVKIFRDTLHVLAQILDYDEGVKSEHARRTALLSYYIAKRLMPNPQDVAYCGFLHDIGSIDLADHIVHHAVLGFADPRARTHAARGALICEPFSLFKPWLPVIANHHERFDGQGFPDGKKGDEIPLAAAIVHCADHLEIFLRGCSPNQRPEASIEEVQRIRGTLVSPEVADAAIESLKSHPGLWEILYTPEKLEIELEMLPDPGVELPQETEDLLVQLLWLLARIIDAKHPYTLGHSARVARLACAIAQKLPEINLWDVLWAGLLHDIGKVALPTSLLNNSSPLTSYQWESMRSHARKSREIIGQIEALRHLAHPAAAHHERYAGGGYPLGLSGENIPLIGRILAYADTYDAMTTRRGYNVVLTHEQALESIQKGAYSHFDPRLMPIALSALENAPKILKEINNSPEGIPSFFHTMQPSVAKLINTSENSTLILKNDEGKMVLLQEPKWVRILLSESGLITQGQQDLASTLLNIQSNRLEDFFEPLDREVLQRELQAAKTAGHASFMVRTLHGLPIEALAVFRDKSYEIFLRSAEKKFYSANRLAMMYYNFNIDQDAVAFVNHEGIIFDANERFSGLVGVSREELLGKPAFPFLSEELALALYRRTPLHAETILIRADQTHAPVDAFLAEFTDATGQPVGFLLRFYDIAQRLEIQAQLKRVSEDLERRNRELENLSRMKSDLLAVTSHDLKSPLSGIIASAQFLLDFPDSSPERVRKGLKRIVESGEKLMSFIQNLLDLERLENGMLPLEKKEIDFRPILENVIRDVDAYARERGIQIRVDIDSSAMSIIGDAWRLEQVLHNLLSNAIKFSPSAASVNIDARIQDGRIVIRVRDFGPGIPEDQLEAIFDRYYQVRNHHADARSFAGSGLGLSIARHIVELHQGHIWAQNAPGGGSLFSVELPLSESAKPRIYLLDPHRRLEEQIRPALESCPVNFHVQENLSAPEEAAIVFVDGQDPAHIAEIPAIAERAHVVVISPPAGFLPPNNVSVLQEPVLDTEIHEILRRIRLQKNAAA